MITLLLIIYTAIAALLGYYLVSHQAKPFLTFDPTKTPAVKNIARYGGSLMLLVAIASCVSIFYQNTALIALTLASGCIIMMGVGLFLMSFMTI
ncbi:hypothetical protein [Lactiplantibacillus mudanjiangensis]|uniref:Integral membrane protein [Lactobacillus plantarum JDM1] n=1 Tax=Lactiplantibacillus mudanjiangensis TaxID=1296538 RepID=A0A660EBL5_9LACO|nr:hypothetical protein [Lactiplantibacillus mudanjiangensis]VDG19168.1 hypothetical protein [Lactobacillus sp. CBA3605] [Lactiplantibacillus mudanjiangensis]VDG25667.1 hypothetical protein [Lactobacillus sp. CBA3605] [Lactiplantibacillus mudanjiangensis]VDG29936.1 hypothetical protein [Lactobacillus sp. CBA3605] [Lactiplantibacillus mudanjiangensis]VDG33238.1 hypothetical protein [Lactobacillus sp. CBA3605] [Lactiplantibacillus mudanjiangensis]